MTASAPAPKIELQHLLSRASARAKENERRQAAEKAVKGAKSAATRVEAVAHLAAMDWRTVSIVYRFTKWKCACGNAGQAPGTIFAYQEHTRIANSTRFQAFGSGTAWPDERTPRFHKIDLQDIPFCDVCAIFDLGFEAELPERRQGLSVPATRGEFLNEWDAFRAPAPDTDPEPDPEDS